MYNFLNDIHVYRNYNKAIPILTACVNFCLLFILIEFVSFQFAFPLYSIIFYYSSYLYQSYIYNGTSKSMYGLTWGIIITIISK